MPGSSLLTSRRNLSYKAALQSDAISTSDVLLLSVELLDKINLNTLKELLTVKVAYINADYNLAKEYLLNFLDNHESLINSAEPGLVEIIKASIARAVDSPEGNESRRYFESVLAIDMWRSLSGSDFDSINRLLQVVKAVNEREPDPRKKIKIDLDRVKNIEEARVVIAILRELGDKNTEILENIIKPVRGRSEMAAAKDRKDQTPEEKRMLQEDPKRSLAMGILKANTPIPQHMLREETRRSKKGGLKVDKNRLVDTFLINREKSAGFSASREHVPFVNSVSGTAYSMIAVLKSFFEENEGMDHEQLNRDANSIIYAFIAFTCMNGYHSFGEMIDVIYHDPAVQELFAQYNVKFNKIVISNERDKIFSEAATYVNILYQRRRTNELAAQLHKDKLQNGWNLDPIDPVSYLKKLKDPKSVILIDTPHTVLQNSVLNQVYVGEICELLGNDNILANVSFSPERLALFHATAFVETEIQRDPEALSEEKKPEDDLHGLVLGAKDQKGLHSLVLEEIAENPQEIEDCLHAIDVYVTQFLHDYINGYLTSEVKAKIEDPLYLECIQMYEIAVKRNVEGLSLLGQYQPGTMIHDILPKAIYTKVYNNMMNKKMSEIVSRVGNRFIDQNQYPRMTLQSGSDRHTFMMSGAPACGKGTAAGKAAQVAHQHGIEWRNMCKINTDDHRSIVSEGLPLGQDARNHAQLNNLEAMMISNLAGDRYTQKLKNGAAPHLLIDTVNPSFFKVQTGLENDGQLHLFTVSLPVDISIDRMMSRGRETGRYVGTSYMIGSHKSVSAELITTLCRLAREGKSIDFVVLDTNVPRGSPPNLIMYGDTGKKEVVVVDEQRAAYFYGKKNINTKGRSLEELYTQTSKENGTQPISRFDESYIGNLISASFTVVTQQELDLQVDQIPKKSSSKRNKEESSFQESSKRRAAVITSSSAVTPSSSKESPIKAETSKHSGKRKSPN